MKEIVLLRLEPEAGFEAGYETLFTYLSSKNRLVLVLVLVLISSKRSIYMLKREGVSVKCQN